MKTILSQLRSILPGAKPTPQCEGPCAAELFVTSRIKRQGTTPPYPRQNDPQPGGDTRFAAELFREAARVVEQPPPPAPPPVLHSLQT